MHLLLTRSKYGSVRSDLNGAGSGSDMSSATQYVRHEVCTYNCNALEGTDQTYDKISKMRRI